jgi:hypothetical protein
MNSKVDKLFKTKLEEHTMAPSAKAWEKVEANLSKKNKPVIWFRIAAVLALAGLFTIAAWKWTEDTTPELVSIPTEKPVEQKEKLKQAEQIKEQTAVVDQKQKTVTTKKKKRIPQQKKSNPLTPVVQENKVAITNEQQPEILKQTEVAVAQTVPSQKAIKLTFSLPTVIKEDETSAVVATLEKKTTLQKAIETANEIRSGDVLGSLRDAKDDLFSWEFKKDKSKKQQ